MVETSSKYFIFCINLPIPTNAILHDEVIVKVSAFSQFRQRRRFSGYSEIVFLLLALAILVVFTFIHLFLDEDYV